MGGLKACSTILNRQVAAVRLFRGTFDVRAMWSNYLIRRRRYSSLLLGLLMVLW